MAFRRAAILLVFCAVTAQAKGLEHGDAERACRDRYEHGRPTEIKKACGECLEHDPRNRTCQQALSFLQTRPRLDVVEHEGRPVTEAMRQSQQHYLSGMIYFQKGDYEKARDEWNLAKQLDPANEDAQMGLVRIEKLYGISDKLKRRAPAAPAGAQPASAAAPLATQESQQHYLAGVIYFQKGDYVKARDEWQLALQLNPANSDARAGLERIDKLYGSSKK